MRKVDFSQKIDSFEKQKSPKNICIVMIKLHFVLDNYANHF